MCRRAACTTPLLHRLPWRIIRLFDFTGTHRVCYMDIAGIGTDIVEVVRIGEMIEKHGEVFLQRVFTPHEIRYCHGRKNAKEHYAGRWAAKEAILKCLGTGWAKGISWTDLDIRNDFSGAPRVTLSGVARDRA